MKTLKSTEVQMVCPKCGRKSCRDEQYIGAALCHACGAVLVEHKVKRGEIQYSFICPSCGEQWKGTSPYFNTCPECNYWCPIMSYEENDVQINAEDYQHCLYNVVGELKFSLHCKECGRERLMYAAEHCWCSCGGLLEDMNKQAEVVEKLKKYRKSHKLSQGALAEKLKISRSLLSMIEVNKRPISAEILGKVKRIVSRV